MNDTAIQQHFKSVTEDHTSGASELLQTTLQLLLELIQREQQPDKLRSKLRDACLYLYQSQQAIAGFFHLANKLLLEAEKTSADNLVAQLTTFLEKYRKQQQDGRMQTAMTALGAGVWHQKTVITHSRSSTVIAFFEYLTAGSRQLRILQTESRPAYEGRLQARQLAGTGLPVTLVTDTAITNYMGEADYLLLGADAVTESYFVNKCGSYMLALLAQEYEVPVLVLTDRTKIVPDAFYHFEEPSRPPDEVWKDAPDSVQVQNRYFEQIPLRLADTFIVDDQRYTPQDLAALNREDKVAESLAAVISG